MKEKSCEKKSLIITIFATLLTAGASMAQEYPGTGAPASWKPPVDDAMIGSFFQVDRSELVMGQGTTGYLWDAQGWIGADYNKFWFKFEGEGDFDSRLEGAELQGLYSHMVSPFFDIQAGIRQDVGPGVKPTTYAVVGLQGLAPYWFEVDSTIFLSDDGDFTARVEAEYDILFTQRLIGQPRVEFNLAAQDVQQLGIGSGLSTVEMGFRLRYEFKREFAPYIGIAWQSAIGNTADFRRFAGEQVSTTSLVAGIRLWF